MVCGKAPRYDEFVNPLPEPPDFTKLPLSRLGAELDATTPLPFRLAVRDGAGGEGLYLRCVPDGDAYLINLVNYGKNARKLNFSGPGTFRDLRFAQTYLAGSMRSVSKRSCASAASTRSPTVINCQ